MSGAPGHGCLGDWPKWGPRFLDVLGGLVREQHEGLRGQVFRALVRLRAAVRRSKAAGALTILTEGAERTGGERCRLLLRVSGPGGETLDSISPTCFVVPVDSHLVHEFEVKSPATAGGHYSLDCRMEKSAGGGEVEVHVYSEVGFGEGLFVLP